MRAGADEKRRLKYPFSACEVLCCEVDEMYSALLAEPALLEGLFAFLQGPHPLGTMRAGYFARVVLCLLARRGPELLAFLETRQALVQHMADHVDTTSIAEARLPESAHACHAFTLESQQAWSLLSCG
jgi:serine/threonine-protein phosphatase 6 regulatory subunit 3